MRYPAYDPATFFTWTKFYGVDFHGLTTIRKISEEKGYGIVAIKEIGSSTPESQDEVDEKGRAVQEDLPAAQQNHEAGSGTEEGKGIATTEKQERDESETTSKLEDIKPEDTKPGDVKPEDIKPDDVKLEYVKPENQDEPNKPDLPESTPGQQQKIAKGSSEIPTNDQPEESNNTPATTTTDDISNTLQPEVSSLKISDDSLETDTAIPSTSQQPSTEFDWEPKILLTVPKDLVLSQGLVEEHAKSDRHLREVLEAAGEFGKTPRGSILLFLLVQATHISTSSTSSPIGVSHPLTQYVASLLPTNVPLPTFYSGSEQELLYGTTLGFALSQKLAALNREFETLQSATQSIEWCERIWWTPAEFDYPSIRGKQGFGFHDWLHIDSLYRSRALDLPGTGHAMVPCVDMANHASGARTSALYETDDDGNAVLMYIPGRDLKPGEEITITYGDAKGDCEMLYSYGFIEEDEADSEPRSAKQLFLDLEIPEDDPLRGVKARLAGVAPGVGIFDVSQEKPANQTEEAKENNDLVTWESDFIYWSAINIEDGLSFAPLAKQSKPFDRNQLPDLEVLWNNEPFHPPDLPKVLRQDPRWDLFHLRATVLLINRVGQQLLLLEESHDIFETEAKTLDGVRLPVWQLIRKLRQRERVLLTRAEETMNRAVQRLAESPAVKAFFEGNDDAAVEEEVEGVHGQEAEEKAEEEHREHTANVHRESGKDDTKEEEDGQTTTASIPSKAQHEDDKDEDEDEDEDDEEDFS